jgi:hypothetical protein
MSPESGSVVPALSLGRLAGAEDWLLECDPVVYRSEARLVCDPTHSL